MISRRRSLMSVCSLLLVLSAGAPLAVAAEPPASESDFVACFGHEKAKRHQDAADCFLRYARAFPAEEGKAPAAKHNAAVNYFKAQRVEDAIATLLALYETHSRARVVSARQHAIKALYAVGEVYRESADYEPAARIYRQFAHRHPKHELAEKALRRATIYGKVLGQWREAVADLELYLARYPKTRQAPRIHLDIVLILRAHDRHKSALKAAEQHLKRFSREPAGVRLRALHAKGMTLEALRKDKRAARVFEDMVAFHRRLRREEKARLSMEERSAIAEAHYHLGDAILSRARAVRVAGSEAAVHVAIRKLLDLVNETKAVYNAVIGYGHPGWTVASYTQLGVAYDLLADAVQDTPAPSRIQHDHGMVSEFQAIMAEKAKAIRRKATESYREALTITRQTHWRSEHSERAAQALAQHGQYDMVVNEDYPAPALATPNSGASRPVH